MLAVTKTRLDLKDVGLDVDEGGRNGSTPNIGSVGSTTRSDGQKKDIPIDQISVDPIPTISIRTKRERDGERLSRVR